MTITRNPFSQRRYKITNTNTNNINGWNDDKRHI